MGYDLFVDGSLIAVDLPGHAAGQIGSVFDVGNRRVLLWSSHAYRERRKPHAVAGLING